MKRLNIWAVMLVACLLCSWKCLPALAQETDRSIQRPELNIAPEIQGQERAMIAPLMDSLPPEDRQNVILYAQDGNIYVNKPELRAQASPLVQVQDNVYQDKTGSLFSIPAYTPKPTQDAVSNDTVPSARGERPNVWNPAPYGGSGPYRQVYSKVPPDDNTPGFSYEDATIYLPSAHRIPDVMRSPGHYRYSNPEIHENPVTQDTAYIYMGGWSAKAKYIPLAGSSGAIQPYFALDAGFQYDKAKHGNYTESWVMSVGAEHYRTVNGAAERAGAFRLVAGQSPIFAAFYVSYGVNANGGHTFLNLRAIANALDYNTGSSLGSGTWTVSEEVTQPMDSNGNSTGKVVDASGNLFCPWNINGNGMVLKRMTSIAQQIKNPSGPGNILTDLPTTCSYIKNAQWNNCHIGISGQSAPVPAWDASSYGSAIDYQYNPAIPNVVTHTAGSGYDETDFITIP
jgi:hypothetical protein